MLRARLQEYAARPLVIGSFSAASNVTGIVTDTDTISALLHEHGALAFWDFAAAAPYVDIEMYGEGGRGVADPAAYKDAVFLSPHKFIGGPSTPGVLVVRRELLTNRVPDVPGGGTVAFVNPTAHDYLTDPAHREEGGTPAIIEAIRAGLVFKLKQAVGTSTIRAREAVFLRRAVEAWQQEPAIEILGNLDAERLSIVSFTVRTRGRAPPAPQLRRQPAQRPLRHPGPGGCSCAGPYGHALLGIDLERSHEFEREIGRGCEGIKPGWVRVNFNYFISDTVADYVIEAVRLVARDGWRLLGDYDFDATSGLWRHHDGPVEPPLRLRQVGFDGGGLRYPRQHDRAGEEVLAEHLEQGRRDPGGRLAGALPRGERQRGLRPPAVVRPARRRACAARPPRAASTPERRCPLRSARVARGPGSRDLALPLPAQPGLGVVALVELGRSEQGQGGEAQPVAQPVAEGEPVAARGSGHVEPPCCRQCTNG